MPELFSLTCPTCGAHLQIAGQNDRFHCEHCGTRYILDHKVGEIDESARNHLSPVATYTEKLGQWLKVAEYDLILHCAETVRVEEENVFYIEVAYQNKTAVPLQYRHDQWIVFDTDGRTYDPVKDYIHPHLYPAERFYLGMTRVISPSMKLRSWLAFVLPGTARMEYLQFSGGSPLKTVEYRIAA